MSEIVYIQTLDQERLEIKKSVHCQKIVLMEILFMMAKVVFDDSRIQNGGNNKPVLLVLSKSINGIASRQNQNITAKIFHCFQNSMSDKVLECLGKCSKG